MAGFRYLLLPENYEPADPAAFLSALPPGMWKVGDDFLAGADVEKFRIVRFNRDVAVLRHVDLS